MTLKKNFKYGMGYKKRKEDMNKREIKMALPKTLPLIYYLFPVCGLGYVIGNLFKDCNSILEDFLETNRLRNVSPGETLDN